MKKLLVILLVVAMVASLVACGGKPQEDGADGMVTWKMATDGTFGNTASGAYTERVKELIEEKSQGKIKVEIYAQGELGDAVQQAEMLQTGSVDLLCHAIGNYGGVLPETQVFTLHFLLSGDTVADNEFLNSDNQGIEMLKKKFLDKKIRVLSWWSEGTNLWSGNKPLNTLASWKGVKVRTIASPIIAASFSAYGANPTTIPFTELYSALQLNTVDAQCNAAALCYGMKYHEVQKCFVDAKADGYVNMLVANPAFYEKLTEEQKAVLDEVAVQMETEAADIVDTMNDEAAEKMTEEGAKFYEITPAEREKFIEASQKAYDAYVKESGGDSQQILDYILEDIR